MYSHPSFPEPVDIDDPDFIPSLTRHLEATRPTDFFQRTHAASESIDEGLGLLNVSSSDDDGELAGRNSLPMLGASRKSRIAKSTQMPSFLQKPEHRPTDHPVEVEYDRFCANGIRGKFERVVDCLGTLADKGAYSPEETQLSRLSELAAFALRGLVDFANRLGTGVYGTEIESILSRQSLSSEPATLSSGTKCPISNRIAKGVANLAWGCADTKCADGECLLRGDFSLRAKTISPNTAQSIQNLRKARKNRLQPICLISVRRCNLGRFRFIWG